MVLRMFVLVRKEANVDDDDDDHDDGEINYLRPTRSEPEHIIMGFNIISSSFIHLLLFKLIESWVNLLFVFILIDFF